MHEYLHKYLENIKKLEKKFSHTLHEAPEQREAPPGRGVRGVLPPALPIHAQQCASKLHVSQIDCNAEAVPMPSLTHHAARTVSSGD